MKPSKSVQLRGVLREESMDHSGMTEELICKGKIYKAKKGMESLQIEKNCVIRNSRPRKGGMRLHKSKGEGREMLLLLYKGQDRVSTVEAKVTLASAEIHGHLLKSWRPGNLLRSLHLIKSHLEFWKTTV